MVGTSKPLENTVCTDRLRVAAVLGARPPSELGGTPGARLL